MRITRKQLDEQLAYIIERTGLPLQFDKHSQGYRVNNGKRDLSPRCRPLEMATWLDGFAMAVSELKYPI